MVSLRQSPGSGQNYPELVQPFPSNNIFINTVYYTLIHTSKMSVSSASGIMLKRTIFSTRLAAQPWNAAELSSRSVRSAALGPYRAVHQSARLPAITPSETRRRPALRPRHQPAAHSRVNGPSPTSKRTIFIQTENTPNPDVSQRTSLALTMRAAANEGC